MRPVNSIDELLEHMVAHNASDLHVTVGTPPVMRVRGEVERMEEYGPLTPEDTPGAPFVVARGPKPLMTA